MVEQNKAEAALPGWIKTPIWYIANKAGNYVYHVNGRLSKGKYGYTVSPGSISYNSGKRGSSSKFSFKITSHSHSVILSADTTIFNWGSKIAVLLTNPSNSDVINKSVTSGQWVGYAPGKQGNYTARFIQTRSQTWTPYLSYRYDRAGASFKAATVSALSDDNNLNLIDIGDNIQTVQKYGNIIIPSSQQTSQPQKYSQSYLQKKTESLNAEQLDRLYVDPVLGIHVYAMREYKPGDVVYFSDKINKIEFDRKNNITIFNFGDDRLNMSFSGDLTKKYSENDSLNLKFNVVKLLDNRDDLYMINYLKYLLDNDGQAPSINTYLN